MVGVRLTRFQLYLYSPLPLALPVQAAGNPIADQLGEVFADAVISADYRKEVVTVQRREVYTRTDPMMSCHVMSMDGF